MASSVAATGTGGQDSDEKNRRRRRLCVCTRIHQNNADRPVDLVKVSRSRVCFKTMRLNELLWQSGYRMYVSTHSLDLAFALRAFIVPMSMSPNLAPVGERDWLAEKRADLSTR